MPHCNDHPICPIFSTNVQKDQDNKLLNIMELRLNFQTNNLQGAKSGLLKQCQSKLQNSISDNISALSFQQL
jgi:hypothetical protein